MRQRRDAAGKRPPPLIFFEVIRVYTVQGISFPRTGTEALSLLRESRNNVVLGGGCWLALGHRRCGMGIDLSRLGWDKITREGDELVIGASVTLRELETNQDTRTMFSGVLSDCVKPIVGVQLRNSATVGGSVYARFGFSDLMTALLTLECSVVLVGEGSLDLPVFAARVAAERDIVKEIRVKLEPRTAALSAMRLTATDLPILTAAVSRRGDDWRVSIGARPARPVRIVQAEEALRAGAGAAAAGRIAGAGTVFGNDLRASTEYRSALAEVLVERCAARLEKGEAV